MKQCKVCLIEKSIDEFYAAKGNLDGKSGKCKECHLEKSRNRHRELAREGRSCHVVLRQKALEILGNKCTRCGFDDPRALQIDHVNGDGYLERGAEDYSRRQVERKIVSGQIEDYQILCANCNWIKKAENNENNTNCSGRPRRFV